MTPRATTGQQNSWLFLALLALAVVFVPARPVVDNRLDDTFLVAAPIEGEAIMIPAETLSSSESKITAEFSERNDIQVPTIRHCYSIPSISQTGVPVARGLVWLRFGVIRI